MHEWISVKLMRVDKGTNILYITEEFLVSCHDLNEFWLPSLAHPPGRHLPGTTGLHTTRFRVLDSHHLLSNRATQRVHLFLGVLRSKVKIACAIFTSRILFFNYPCVIIIASGVNTRWLNNY